MLTQDQTQALKSPFPPEALSADTSRGFELTSIKAAQASAVIERLNEVFGLCGTGWRYAHSLFEEVHTDNERRGDRHRGRLPVPAPRRHRWHRMLTGHVGQRLGVSQRWDWSEPILALSLHLHVCKAFLSGNDISSSPCRLVLC
jgi:hypothetical protein